MSVNVEKPCISQMEFLRYIEEDIPRFKEKFEILKAKNNSSNFFWLALNYAIIFSSILISSYSNHFIVYVFAILVIGSRMRALDNLTHETSHGLLFKNKRLNQFFGKLLCAFPIGNSLYAYQNSHMRHHKFLGNIDADPDRIRYREMGVDSQKLLRKKFLMKLLGFLTFVNTPKFLLSLSKNFIYMKGTPLSELFLRSLFLCSMMLTLSYFGLWNYFLLYWCVPFLFSFQTLRFLAELSEHSGLYDNKEFIMKTRNNIVNPLLRFFLYPHGDAYHLTHHLFPSVPHYNLPKLHALLMQNEKYKAAHHCYGYWQSDKGKPSTLSEILV